MTVYLNIRQDLTYETREKMKKECKIKGLSMGNLLNEHFK